MVCEDITGHLFCWKIQNRSLPLLTFCCGRCENPPLHLGKVLRDIFVFGISGTEAGYASPSRFARAWFTSGANILVRFAWLKLSCGVVETERNFWLYSPMTFFQPTSPTLSLTRFAAHFQQSKPAHVRWPLLPRSAAVAGAADEAVFSWWW